MPADMPHAKESPRSGAEASRACAEGAQRRRSRRLHSAAPRLGSWSAALVLGGALALVLIVLAPPALRWPILGALAVLALPLELGWRRRVRRAERRRASQ